MDISIPIYFKIPSLRYKHTIKIFKYLNIIKKKLIKENINLSFTVVGEDTEDYINLMNYLIEPDEKITKNNIDEFNKSDNKSSYIRFSQSCGGNYYDNGMENNFRYMLDAKFKSGILQSTRKNPDISFLMGSNDLISENFFIEVKNKFIENEHQFYGINRFNPVLFFKLGKALQLKLNRCFVWNGLYKPENGPNSDVKYCGGIYGCNNISFEKYTEYNNFSNEIAVERYMGNFCKLYLLENTHYFNIKSDIEITGLSSNEYPLLAAKNTTNLVKLFKNRRIKEKFFRHHPNSIEKILKDIELYNSINLKIESISLPTPDVGKEGTTVVITGSVLRGGRSDIETVTINGVSAAISFENDGLVLVTDDDVSKIVEATELDNYPVLAENL